MDTEPEIDSDALAAYHIVLASLKHPQDRQNEAMRLLRREQVEWVLSALGAHAQVRSVQWDAEHAWAELAYRGRAVSPIPQRL